MTKTLINIKKEQEERLLALDAALCACEGAIDDDEAAAAAEVIQSWLDRRWPWGVKKDQLEMALRRLADSPEAWS